MKTEQKQWTAASGWLPAGSPTLGDSAQVVLVFGAPSILKNTALMTSVQAWYKNAQMLACSTAGEIQGAKVSDDSLAVTAVCLEHTQIKGVSVNLSSNGNSFEAGEHLARALPQSMPGAASGEVQELAHVLVLSDGLRVNGSDL